MDKFKILQIQDEQNPKNNNMPDIPENLPNIKNNALILLVGKVRASKSTIISNLLLNDSFYNDMFDDVTIISQTASQDVTSRFLVDKYSENVFNDYDDNIVKSIVESQKEFSKEDMPARCIIIDDCIGAEGLGRGSYLWYLCSRYRHYNLTLIITTQVFKYCPPVLRANCSDLLICWNINDREILKIAEEFGDSFFHGIDRMLKIYKDLVQRDPYTFLYIQTQTGRVYKTFTNELNIREL